MQQESKIIYRFPILRRQESKGSTNVRNWLATVVSVCLFNMVEVINILLQVSSLKLGIRLDSRVHVVVHTPFDRNLFLE